MKKEKKETSETIKKKMDNIKVRKELLEQFLDHLNEEEKLDISNNSEEIEEIRENDHKQEELEIEKLENNELETEEIESEEFINEELSTNIIITINAILKIASHALKYANEKIPQKDWVEVIGILSGRLVNNEETLLIEDAYPMGHGNAVYAEIKDYKNYVRAWKDIRKNNQDIVGWYHSHPSYSPFISEEDFGTQARYQKLWDRTVALVIDPFEIDGTRLGFEIFQADLETGEWFGLPFEVSGNLDVKSLPEILEFLNPIIDGKAAFLEYDEE